MSEGRQTSYYPVLIGGIVGAVGGFFLFILAFLSAFSICSDTFIAEALFPFSIAVDPSLNEHVLLALLLALVQFPIYGIILGITWSRCRVDKSWLMICGLALLVGHAIAVGVAKHRVNAMWEERFSSWSKDI